MKISRSKRPLLWFSLFALSTIGSAQAQPAEAPDSALPRLKRLSISVYGGAAIGGTAGALESDMRAAGLDKTTPPYCFLGMCNNDYIPHPETQAGASSMLALKYRLRPQWAIQLQYGSASTGRTIGNAGGFGALLVLDHGVRTLAALATFEEGPLQLGLGPALHVVRVVDEPQQTGGATEVSKLGLVVDAGLQFPRNSRFFVDLRAQYRWVGSATVGPYTASIFDESAVLPESSLSFNHAWFGIGVGFRL